MMRHTLLTLGLFAGLASVAQASLLPAGATETASPAATFSSGESFEAAPDFALVSLHGAAEDLNLTVAHPENVALAVSATAQTPEPASFVYLFSGLAGLVVLRRLRDRRKAEQPNQKQVPILARELV